MGCASSKSQGNLTEEEVQKMKKCEQDSEDVLKELQQIMKKLELAKQDFFMDAQLSDMNMSINQIPYLIDLTYKVVQEQQDQDNKKQLFNALKEYSNKLLQVQKLLPPLFKKAEASMEEYKLLALKKNKKASKKYPTNFDRLNCLLRQLKLVAYDLEVPDILKENINMKSNQLTESEQQRLNNRLASIINCLAVSVKID
ncbi:hypothetical protein ABPG74_021783 [Tetrahymena malaccensis]